MEEGGVANSYNMVENGHFMDSTGQHTAQCWIGDQLQLLNGQYVVVEAVQHEILEKPVKIYNLEVEDFHTYYVGRENIVLVHNTNCVKNTTKLWDINKYSKGSLRFRFQGKSMVAQYDGKYYWAKDLAGHGDSAFKVYRKVGNELQWIADADKYGNWIIGKNKGAVGKVIKF